MKILNFGMKCLATMLAILGIILSSTSFAQFKAKPTWHLMKDTHLLASASRQLTRMALRDVGDHPISIESKRFRKTIKVFIYKFKRYRLFTHKPDTEIIRRDFRIVQKGFRNLRQSMSKHYKVDGMKRIRRKYDKLIYRYHRLRHSIDVHILEAKRD